MRWRGLVLIFARREADLFSRSNLGSMLLEPQERFDERIRQEGHTEVEIEARESKHATRRVRCAGFPPSLRSHILDPRLRNTGRRPQRSLTSSQVEGLLSQRSDVSFPRVCTRRAFFLLSLGFLPPARHGSRSPEKSRTPPPILCRYQGRRRRRRVAVPRKDDEKRRVVFEDFPSNFFLLEGKVISSENIRSRKRSSQAKIKGIIRLKGKNSCLFQNRRRQFNTPLPLLLSCSLTLNTSLWLVPLHFSPPRATLSPLLNMTTRRSTRIPLAVLPLRPEDRGGSIGSPVPSKVSSSSALKFSTT